MDVGLGPHDLKQMAGSTKTSGTSLALSGAMSKNAKPKSRSKPRNPTDVPKKFADEMRLLTKTQAALHESEEDRDDREASLLGQKCFEEFKAVIREHALRGLLGAWWVSPYHPARSVLIRTFAAAANEEGFSTEIDGYDHDVSVSW